MDWSGTTLIIGASFTGLTVKINDVESINSPSVTDTCISISPLKSWLGVIVNWLPSIIRSVSPSDAENVKSSPSTSLADKESVKLVSSSMLWFWIKSRTGASLIETTSKLKFC